MRAEGAANHQRLLCRQPHTAKVRDPALEIRIHRNVVRGAQARHLIPNGVHRLTQRAQSVLNSERFVTILWTDSRVCANVFAKVGYAGRAEAPERAAR